MLMLREICHVTFATEIPLKNKIDLKWYFLENATFKLFFSSVLII